MPPELEVIKCLDGLPVAWRCSVCGKAIESGRIYTSPLLLKELWDKHCHEEHGPDARNTPPKSAP